jgi:small-conductance mechanosensitive channel
MVSCIPVAAILNAPLGTSFWDQHRNGLTAIATILVAIAVAQLADRAIARRGSRLRERFGAELSPVASTRLRLVRRLIFAAIIVVGIGLALSQFPSIKRFATGLLASSAILGIVVGFAARQTIANAIAGILLAITQPIRIGDLVTFKDSSGTVEDVRLTYTYMRAADGRRIVIPNEQLASSAIENHSIGTQLRAEASVWVPTPSDAVRAVSLLAEPDVDVSVAEIDKDGIRLLATTWVSNPAERDRRSAGLRAACLERLAKEGLSSDDRASRPSTE